MVDEFQDTNSCSASSSICSPRPETGVFFVGDEFQSIYGFRHADVGVFRERRDRAAQLLALTKNYRSRAGGARGGQRAVRRALRRRVPAARRRGRVSRSRVRSSGRAARHRQGELRGERRALAARRSAAIARRVRELVDAGAATAGEISCSSPPAPTRSGTRTSCAAGPADVPRDRPRILRPAAGRRPARVPAAAAQPLRRRRAARRCSRRRSSASRTTRWRCCVAPPRSVRSSRASSSRCRRARRAGRAAAARVPAAVRAARRASARLSLERLCERIVSEHDYDLAVLAQWDGRRRYANMRKLARLARSYEELRGPDVEGFVRFVAEQEAVGASELEAVAEEEGADAVRLLTIHAAKGLEFKVVIVADAGRDKAPPSADEILALADGRFGFRVADPVTSQAPPRLRLRGHPRGAKRRGGGGEAAPLLRRDDARERPVDRLRRGRSERTADASTPIGWVLGRLDAERRSRRRRRAGRDRARHARGGPRRPLPRPRARRRREPASRGGPARALRRARRGRAGGPGARPAALVAPAAPPLHRPRRLSFTALSPFDQCSYKYYAIRVPA